MLYTLKIQGCLKKKKKLSFIMIHSISFIANILVGVPRGCMREIDQPH